jgi:uncharacterized protein YebE (UPF0316 family)
MDLNWDVLFTCAFIIIARVVDVSLGTLRTVYTVGGHRFIAWSIGFVEILIWVIVVSKVIQSVDGNLLYAVCYAFGFALGTYVGITIERHLAIGDQVVRIFTRQGYEMAIRLRGEGFGVTEIDGRGKDGPISVLFIKTPRRRVGELQCLVQTLDAKAYYVIDDIRFAGPLQPTAQVPTGWRAVLKKK